MKNSSPHTLIEPLTMTKKQRSNRPRRNRTQFSPILYFSAPTDVSCDASSALTSNSTLTLYSKRHKLHDFSSFPPKNDVEASETSCVESNNKEAVLTETDTVSAAESCFNDLACTEELSYNEVVSECEWSEGFSELSFSDYTASSGSEFSECDESVTCKSFELLIEFRRLFIRSSVSLDHSSKSSSSMTLDNAAFEEQEDEESYKLLRERERKAVYKHDYVELYRSTTDYGELVFHQRLQMIHWIVEQSNAIEYEEETMFLGVSLLDRFLSKGLFKNKRNLQILGIACLALATRIHENQPYNTIRQRIFRIGSNEYNRFEVVAMEWLVQEVLNFQCFMPTISDFMWFYLKAAKADAAMEKRAKYLAVLGLSDHEQLAYWPSTVAAALVILACVETNAMDSYHRVIEVHVRTKENDLHECIKNLEWLLQYVN